LDLLVGRDGTRRHKEDVGFLQVSAYFLIGDVVGCHDEGSGVSEDDWATVDSVRVELAVDTVANPQEGGGHNDVSVFAHINRAGLSDSRHHYCAVHTVADLSILDTRVNVDVGLFTGNDPDILVLQLLIHDGHALVEAVQVDDVVFHLVSSHRLHNPLSDDIHVHLH